MGRKRGLHITGVKGLVVPAHLFIVSFKLSKCKYARVRMGVVQATDALDAAIKFKRKRKNKNRIAARTT